MTLYVKTKWFIVDNNHLEAICWGCVFPKHSWTSLKILCVILVGIVEAEWCLSCIRQIHNWLRNSMSTDLLGDVIVIVMYVYKNLIWKTDTCNANRTFLPHRKIESSLFTEAWCTLFFYKQPFFNLALVLLNSFEKLSFKCCLGVAWYTQILRRFLHLLYLCPCLDLGLFMSYICNLFFQFRLHFYYD